MNPPCPHGRSNRDTCAFCTPTLERPEIDEYFIQMLHLVGSRSTCGRRATAAIITDLRGHVLATGYNGVPRGFRHCRGDFPCEGLHDAPGDTHRCLAVHAEINAIIQCSRLEDARIIYTSCAPCFDCAKVIANTRIETVICLEPYTPAGASVLNNAGIGLRFWTE
jgi:dCMP deaminase